jgi:hypothetical protein
MLKKLNESLNCVNKFTHRALSEGFLGPSVISLRLSYGLEAKHQAIRMTELLKGSISLQQITSVRLSPAGDLKSNGIFI